ncbi:MAG TPA: flagellar basal-body MS-ring/collar protein FliF [Gemmataceae bacterium]|nr:flagellar basal-body MS-ring/collar protein FliF [Gemmataceae bacterium]
MDFFRRLGQQLREVWAGMSPVRRALAVAALLLVVALLVGLYFYNRSQQGDWAVLYSHLSPDEAQSIRDRLQAQGTPVRLTSDNTTIEVPAERVGTTRIDLASQGLPAQTKGYELFDEPSLGTTPFRDEVNLLRAKQAVIAKTIRQLDPVANATVEIAKPESSPFLRERQPTTAAVMVQLRPNATLTRSQVAGIVAFVSKSVEGLAPENVTVVDGRGNQMSEPGGPEAGAVSSQLDYRRAVETYLAEKAQSILVSSLGPGRAVVKVTADINFQHHKEVRDSVNPEQKTVKSERTSSSKTQSSGGGARGVAGASSNLALRQPNAALAAGGGGGASTSSQEESETTYDYTRTHSELEDKLGSVNRLTVAATVDLTPPEGGQPPMTKEAVTGLIREALGYDEARGDTIRVEVAKLAAAPSPPPPEPERPAETDKEWWRKPEVLFMYLRNGALAMAVAVLVLVMLLVVFLLFRRTAPTVVVAPPPPPATTAAEREAVAERLASAAQRDPEALARAIARLMEQE